MRKHTKLTEVDSFTAENPTQEQSSGYPIKNLTASHFLFQLAYYFIVKYPTYFLLLFPPYYLSIHVKYIFILLPHTSLHVLFILYSYIHTPSAYFQRIHHPYSFWIYYLSILLRFSYSFHTFLSNMNHIFISLDRRVLYFSKTRKFLEKYIPFHTWYFVIFWNMSHQYKSRATHGNRY